MKRLSHNTGLQLITLLAVVFAISGWASQGVKFAAALLLTALIVAGAGDRMTRVKVSARDAAWIAALQSRESELRESAAGIEHDDIEQAVDYERRANAVQQAHYAALDTVRGRR